jgi:hypothetical protein
LFVFGLSDFFVLMFFLIFVLFVCLFCLFVLFIIIHSRRAAGLPRSRVAKSFVKSSVAQGLSHKVCRTGFIAPGFAASGLSHRVCRTLSHRVLPCANLLRPFGACSPHPPRPPALKGRNH